MQWLEKRPLVKLGLGLDKLTVDPAESRIVTEGERIVDWLLDRIVGVAAHAVQMGDRVAARTRNPGLRRRIVDIVEVGIVELASEEDHRIVASGAEACSLNGSIPLQGDLPCLPH